MTGARLIAARVAVPEVWFADTSRAILAAKGRLPVAAAALGVSLPTLKRWVTSDKRLARIRPPVPRGWRAWTPTQRARGIVARRKKRSGKRTRR